MICLQHKELPAEVTVALVRLQNRIDQNAIFAQKIEEARKLWKSKGGKDGTLAFIQVKDTLFSMSGNKGFCIYCEQNEATDIEHILPKAYFPELTFHWSNLLLACKQCNTGYKLDKCFVLNEQNDVVSVSRNTEPIYKEHAFINPRVENPDDFMMLCVYSHRYLLLPELSKKDANKAQKTIDILELNNRDVLLQSRYSAARHFYDTLCRLVCILNADSVEKLKEILSPYDDRFDFSLELAVIKQEIKMSYKQYIATYHHPSVWSAIKIVESKYTKKWVHIFEAIPEALTW